MLSLTLPKYKVTSFGETFRRDRIVILLYDSTFSVTRCLEYFFNIRPFTAMKILPNYIKNLQIGECRIQNRILWCWKWPLSQLFTTASLKYFISLYEIINPYLQHLRFNVIGRGRGRVVSVYAFYSDDPSLNPGEVYSFLLFISVRNEQK